jgi:nicotinamidase-related amidase
MASLALLVVDLQRGLDDPSLGRRNNPACEGNIADLVDAWRAAGQPVVFVRHDSLEPHSTLRPGQPGNDFKEVLAGEPSLLVTKQVNSAFHGRPDLGAWLRERGIADLAICGVQANICCESSARVASDLGFDVRFVLDATYTFDVVAPDGGVITAAELMRVTHANLDPEFCRVIDTREAVAELGAFGETPETAGPRVPAERRDV